VGMSLFSALSGASGFADQFRFGLQPVIHVVAVLVAALFVQLICAAADLFFDVRRTEFGLGSGRFGG